MSKSDLPTSHGIAADALGVDLNELDDARKLSPTQLGELRTLLSKHFHGWKAPPSAPGELRVWTGSAYAGPDAWLVNNMALWAHTVVVRDPLDMWLEEEGAYDYPSPRVQDFEYKAAALNEAISRLRELSDGLDSNVLLLAPSARALAPGGYDGFAYDEEQYLAARALMNEPAFGAQLAGVPIEDWMMAVTEGDPQDIGADFDPEVHLRWTLGEVPKMGEEVMDRVQHDAMAVADELLQCAASQARFVPLDAPGRSVLDVVSNELRTHAQGSPEEAVVRTLLDIRLPRLDATGKSRLIRARKNDEMFHEWRAFLSELLLGARATATSSGADLQKVVDYQVQEEVRKVRQAVSRSKSLTSYVGGDLKVDVTLVSATAGAALQFGTPLAAVVPPIVRIAVQVLRHSFPKKRSDPPGVLLSLMSDERPNRRQR